jgi:hypothetical protein
LDWIDTVRASPAPAPIGAGSDYQPEAATNAFGRFETARESALSHSIDRWRGAHDLTWLIAALSLADEDDPQAPELLRAADQVPPSDPAWISVQHHILRLTLNHVSAADSRRRLDAILASGNLSVSDRNVFDAQRAQVADDLDDFVRFAMRKRLCVGADIIDYEGNTPPACVRERWDLSEVQPSGIYDGIGDKGAVGLGEDARAIIDRAPLADRIALSRDARLPAKLRLDIAMTSYGRAVQLQNNAAIDKLANELASLLPIMSRDFRAIPRAQPGPDKRFAEFLVLAKIPGIRNDLVDYVRPEGAHIADFQVHWTDWVILRRPDAAAAPPPLVGYQEDGTGFEGYVQGTWPDAITDLTCLGECGRGSAPLRMPDFIRASAAKASDERAFFFKTDHLYDQPPPPMPEGAVDVWDEMLTYAEAHRTDPRVPEALHWLVHVGHFGGSHNHSGRRAFKLLHARYPKSEWTAKTPYYDD